MLVLSSVYGALYLEVFYESYADTSKLSETIRDLTINGALLRFLGVFVLLLGFFFLCIYISKKHRNIIDGLFKYRYLIAGIVLVILVIFEINGSSMGYFVDIMGYDSSNEGILFGHPRGIRTDEYDVYTPMCVSQIYNNFNVYSDYLTLSPENMTMTYGAPTLTPVTIFRPFLWGYILLGATKGLSFFWCSRLIILFLASFEFGRILTKDKRCLSLLLAMLVTFSPIVQWWYAISPGVEILISGELLCVFLYYMLVLDKRSVIFAFLIPWLCGVYLFSLYPAWQVICFYIFALFGIIFAVQRLRLNKLCKTPKSPMLVISVLGASLLIFGVLIGISLYQGLDVIKATQSSIYPGSRFSTGGGLINVLNGKTNSTYFALNSNDEFNASEAASGFGLWFFSLVFGVIVTLKKKNKTLFASLCLYLFFLVYGLIGFPEIVSKIMLLSNVTVKRMIYATDLLSMYILIKTLSILSKDDFNVKNATIISILILVNILFVNHVWSQSTRATLFLVGLLIVAILCLVFCCVQSVTNGRLSYEKFITLIAFVAVVLPGLCVNPVTSGFKSLEASPEYITYQELQDKDPNIVVAANQRPMTRMTSYLGIKSLGIQVYPLWNLWDKLDKDHEYEDAWNRYAHFELYLIKNDEAFRAEKIASDTLRMGISINDLKSLGVTYFVSSNFVGDQLDILDSEATKVAQTDKCTFYKL